MLERFIYFKEEIETILEKAKKLPNKNKKGLNLEKFTITTQEWDYLILIRDILEIFKKPIIKFQATNYSTIYYIIPYITRLLNKLENYTIKKKEINSNYNIFIEIALKEAINKTLEYYPIRTTREIDPKLKTLYLVIVLNPQFKLEVFKKLDFDPIIIERIKDYFIEIYLEYKSNYYIPSNITTNIENNNKSNNIDYSSDNDFFQENSTIIEEEEINIYLREKVIVKEIDIIGYYKINKDRFPIIYNIAKDYLAIPSTSSASESKFSEVSNIVTK